MYRKVDFDINGDERFRELSPQPPSAQGLFIQLLIGKHTTMLPGVIPASTAEVSAALGWPIDARALPKTFGEPSWEGCLEPLWEGYAQGCPHGVAAMAELVEFNMAIVDERAGLIWLPNALKRNPPPSPNHLTAWSREWERVPVCELKHDIYWAWRVFFDGYGEGYTKVFGESFGEPYPKGLGECSTKGCRDSGSRKQEAESRKETKTKSKAKPSDCSLVAADYLRKRILEDQPSNVLSKKPWNEGSATRLAWGRVFDTINKIDGRNFDDIAIVVAWLFDEQNAFVVQSPTSLRGKWDRIDKQRNNSQKSFGIIDDSSGPPEKML